ncbi:hypothetical protein ES705_21418 [subsurface metagenome]
MLSLPLNRFPDIGKVSSPTPLRLMDTAASGKMTAQSGTVLYLPIGSGALSSIPL